MFRPVILALISIGIAAKLILLLPLTSGVATASMLALAVLVGTNLLRNPNIWVPLYIRDHQVGYPEPWPLGNRAIVGQPDALYLSNNMVKTELLSEFRGETASRLTHLVRIKVRSSRKDSLHTYFFLVGSYWRLNQLRLDQAEILMHCTRHCIVSPEPGKDEVTNRDCDPIYIPAIQCVEAHAAYKVLHIAEHYKTATEYLRDFPNHHDSKSLIPSA